MYIYILMVKNKSHKKIYSKINKKLKRTTRKNKKGGVKKCETMDEILEFRNRIINFWRDKNWNELFKQETTISKKRKYSPTQTPLEFYPKQWCDKKKPLIHHPIISFLLNNGYDFEEAMKFYCITKRIGEPEYEDILCQLKAYNDDNPDINNLKVKFLKNLKSDYYKNQNVLQPSVIDIFILQNYINDNEYKEMNNLQSTTNSQQKQWETYLKLFSNKMISGSKIVTNTKPFFDFDILGSGHDIDLENRAKIVADRCIKNPNINFIYTMDGHGRFICYLISELFNHSINFFTERPEFKIFVYDIDDETNMWHQMTMPLDVAKTGDIFIELNNSITDNSIENKFFYLNFSGLCNTGGEVQKVFEQLSTNNDNLHNFLVSFSTCRSAKIPSEKLNDFIQTFNENLDNTHKIIRKTERSFLRKGKDVCDGLGDFVTFGTDNNEQQNILIKNETKKSVF